MIAVFLQLFGIFMLVASCIYLFAGGAALIQLRTFTAILGAILALFMIGVGTALNFLEDIRNDTRKSAEALDRLAQTQTGVASRLPPDAAKRLKQLDPHK